MPKRLTDPYVTPKTVEITVTFHNSSVVFELPANRDGEYIPEYVIAITTARAIADIDWEDKPDEMFGLWRRDGIP